MTSGDKSIEDSFIEAATRQLDASAAKIEHCLRQLNDNQLWWQPTAGQNSVGNLLLHLSGNIRQWIISGVGGAKDVRDRPREFVAKPDIPRDALLASFRQTVAEARRTLAACDAASLLRERRIQGYETTGLTAVFDTVAHFQGHTQEIISLTRQQLGDAYEFHWTPATAEEMSAQNSEPSDN